MLALKTSKRNAPSAAREVILEANGDGEGSLERPPPRPHSVARQAPGAPLLGLHHLFVGRRRRAAVGRRWRVGRAAQGRVGLHLESHGHGVPGRIHPWSSGVRVIQQSRLLGSWKTNGRHEQSEDHHPAPRSPAAAAWRPPPSTRPADRWPQPSAQAWRAAGMRAGPWPPGASNLFGVQTTGGLTNSQGG